MNIERCEVCGDAERCGVDGCTFEPECAEMSGNEPAKMMCPGCNLPMLDGQAFNGAYGCHWDCTGKVREQERRDNPRPPTESDLRWLEFKKSVEDLGDLAERLEKERDALQQLLNDRDEKLDALEAEKYALEDQVRGLQELMKENKPAPTIVQPAPFPSSFSGFRVVRSVILPDDMMMVGDKVFKLLSGSDTDGKARDA